MLTDLIASLLIVGVLSAPGAEDVRRAADSVLQEANYQQEFPDPSPPDKIEAPDWLSDLFSFVGRIFEGDILGVLVIVVVVGLIVLVVATAIRDARRSRRERGEEDDESAAKRRPGGVELPDPEALAGEGRFAEALRALLLAALAEIPERVGKAVPVSLTSREILRNAEMPARSREELVPLVALVELSLFGGDEVGPTDYERGVGHLSGFRAGWETAT